MFDAGRRKGKKVLIQRKIDLSEFLPQALARGVSNELQVPVPPPAAVTVSPRPPL